MTNEIANIKTSADPFERIALEEGGGTPVKFAKGEWAANEVVINGTRHVAQMDQLAHGWRKWADKKIVNADIGYVAEGFQPKSRGELDDADESAWLVDTQGKRNDPWQFGYYLRLVAEDGEALTWSATSSGARKAVGSLARTYSHRRKRNLSGLPIVELKTDFYRHKEFGKVDTPVLSLVGWTDDKTAAIAAPDNINTPAQKQNEYESAGADSVDEIIPF